MTEFGKNIMNNDHQNLEISDITLQEKFRATLMVHAKQWHPISSSIDSDDCRKPNGRDGYPCSSSSFDSSKCPI